MEESSFITWRAHEYYHEPKSIDWFWAVGIIGLCIAITSVIYGNFLFAILIVIAVATLCMYAAKHPRMVSFELNDKGVVIENKIYLYSSLQSFWVEENNVHPHPKVLIKSQKLAMPLIVIPINDTEVHPLDIRDFLLVHLEEEEHFEPLSQKIMEHLGF